MKRNPLLKRLPRELIQGMGKYLVIFLLLTATIGFVSGFLVADGSMMTAYENSFEDYNIENGNFTLTDKMNKAQKKSIESFGVKLYDNFYTEKVMDYGATMRIFKIRNEVNLICVMEGRLPEKTDEIAIDRMHADNNSIKTGDKIIIDGKSLTVTGLVALSDYSCLFSDNNDTMFDAIKFGVGVVTDEEFDNIAGKDITYCYSWKYDTEPVDELEEKDISEDLMDVIFEECSLDKYIPRYVNQAIKFTGDDMGSDRSMILVLLYIIIAIMAFIFGIIIGNTIISESNVIGTLRAMGYTNGELIRHYMATPAIVTLISAVIGNILGYTFFKNVCAAMYYGSYSLPTYVTIWSGEAFFLTTVIPVIMMMGINYITLMRKLKFSPLDFLRGDLSKKKNKRALPLSKHIPFFMRFRMRVVMQNMSNYIILFIGVIFANILLLFGLGLPGALDNYTDELLKNLLCNYQYILQVPMAATDDKHKLKSALKMLEFMNEVETDNEDAEKFSVYTLETKGDVARTEEVMIYGVEKDSRYIRISPAEGTVYISSSMADKYGYVIGDEITLNEKYKDDTYTFTVGGIYEYIGGIAIFMYREDLNELFDYDRDFFCGYLSDTEITDIDSKYIGSVIDINALTKISRQLEVSMGSMMGLVDVFSMLIFMVVIYILSKIIIEKNARSISMTKILGYNTLEIGRLYVISTSIMVVISIFLSLPIVKEIILVLFRAIIMESMSGWLPLVIKPDVYIKMIIMGICTYAIVAILELWKIKRVPMEEALKCRE